MYRASLLSSLSAIDSGVCAFLNAWIFSPSSGLSAKLRLYEACYFAFHWARMNTYQVINVYGVSGITLQIINVREMQVRQRLTIEGNDSR